MLIISLCENFMSLGFAFGVPIVTGKLLLPLGRLRTPPLVETPSSLLAMLWMVVAASLALVWGEVVLTMLARLSPFLDFEQS